MHSLAKNDSFKALSLDTDESIVSLPFNKTLYCRALAMSGRKSESQRHLEALQERYSQDPWVKYESARIFSLLGKPDIALGELEDLQRLQPRWQPTVMADNCLKLTISSHRSKVEDLFFNPLIGTWKDAGVLQLEFQANGTVRQKNGSETKTGSFRRDGQTLVMGVDSSTKEFAFKISDNILTIESNKGAYSLTKLPSPIVGTWETDGFTFVFNEDGTWSRISDSGKSEGTYWFVLSADGIPSKLVTRRNDLINHQAENQFDFRCSANKLEVKRPSEQSYFVYKKTR